MLKLINSYSIYNWN